MNAQTITMDDLNKEYDKYIKSKEVLDSLQLGTFVDNIMSTTNTYISTFIILIYLHIYSIMVLQW